MLSGLSASAAQRLERTESCWQAHGRHTSCKTLVVRAPEGLCGLLHGLCSALSYPSYLCISIYVYVRRLYIYMWIYTYIRVYIYIYDTSTHNSNVTGTCRALGQEDKLVELENGSIQ